MSTSHEGQSPRFGQRSTIMGTQFAESTGESMTESVKHRVEDAPAAFVMAAFGLGMCIGASVAYMLSGPQRHEPESFTERLGESVLRSLRNVVPDQVMNRFHS